MRILIYGIYYTPDLTGISKYTGEMAEWLAIKGHQVEVITAMPFYPEWKIKEDYRWKIWHTENINRVKVHRTPFYVPKKVTGKTRILHDFSFLISSQIHWFKKIFQPFDIIISISPPFHLGLPALFYGFLKRVPVIYHIQDLQIDIARDLNIINNNKILNFLFKVERFILNKCAKVSSISVGMINKIKAKEIEKGKVIFLPNWVDTNFIKPLPKKDSLKLEWGFKDEDKIILYAGNLGEKQGLEMLIDVAHQLKDKNIHFLIVGEGGIKTKLLKQVEKLGLPKVHFYPLQPYEKLSALLASADLHLILQKKTASDLVMPSKLISILSAAGVAIVTAEEGSSLFEVVAENEIGIIVEPENTQALIEGILLGLESDLNKYKKNAQEYARKYLSKENILKQFESDLESILLNKKLKYRKSNTL